MTVAVADSADGNQWIRAARVADVVRAFRRGELNFAHDSAVLVVRIDRDGTFSVVLDPEAAVTDAIGRTRRKSAREELVDAYADPPADHVVLGVADRRGLTLAHVRRSALVWPRGTLR